MYLNTCVKMDILVIPFVKQCSLTLFIPPHFVQEVKKIYYTSSTLVGFPA